MEDVQPLIRIDTGRRSARGRDDPAEPPSDSMVDPRFQTFYGTHFAATVRLARLLTGDPYAAEDIAQEAFIRLYRFGASGRRIDNPIGLLRTTTVNLCRTWHTSQQRARLRLVRHGLPDEALSGPDRDPDASLRRLPHHQRAVIVLRFWLRLSEAEIAVTLGCRPGTVKSRQARALRTLRKELA